ncbi:hypothetical protein AB4Y32_25310 [Paraburkholderia phymatum]|uniref:Uncharacterized protein n=1 Tax=Paraburkholderia phymatum TaxID=148447 RepID=A0ACC6U5Z0_9BURK
MSGLKDMNGKPFTEGCRFLKPYKMWGDTPMIEERIAHIRDGKLYSEGSKVPIRFPDRCYILD